MSQFGMAAIDTLLRGAFMPKPPDQPGIGGQVGLAPGGQRPTPQWLVNMGDGKSGLMAGGPGEFQAGQKLPGSGITVQGQAKWDPVQGRYVEELAGPGETGPYNIPTMGELDRLGREAVQGQFEADTEQFESGKATLDQQKEDVDVMRLEKEEQLAAAQEERTQTISDFEAGLTSLEELPDDVRAEAYGNVESMKQYMENRIGGVLATQRTEYEGMRDIIESMNREHFAQARDLTAEMLQATGSGVMTEVGNTVRGMQSDPRFQEMSADQQAVALSTVRLQGSAQIGSTLASVGAQERTRLDKERFDRDALLVGFDTAYQAERGATTRALEGELISQVGGAQREAGKAVTDAMVASEELMVNVRSDMADYKNRSRLAEQQFVAAQNALILQGNRDAFTMNSALVRPVLASGMMNHAAAMLELGLGLLQLDYNNRLNAMAVETGYRGSMLEPFEGAMAYEAQKDIAEAGKPDDPGFDWGGLIPSVGFSL